MNFTNLPNSITIARIIAAIPVVFLLSDSGWGRIAGGIIFLVASLSDLLDGYFARKRGEVTEIGKLADPLADKVLLLSGITPLVECGDVPSWLAVLIFSREFAVMGLRCIVASKGVVVAADVWGKVKTVIYTVAVVALIFGLKRLGLALLYAGVIVSLISAFNYFVQNKKFLT